MSSRRHSRKSSRNYATRRRLAACTPRRMTSSGTPVVTSSSNHHGTLDRISPGISQCPSRGRTPSKYNHRTESPTMTSWRKPQEPPRGIRNPSSPCHEEFPSVQACSSKPDHRTCIRSTSLPPPSTSPTNPFSPFWNFLFKGQKTSRRSDDEEDVDHVCNTVRSPRRSWFGSSAVITNVYLSTVNRWTGVWPTASSSLATGRRRQANDEDSEVENRLLMSPVERQSYHTHHAPAYARQVYMGRNIIYLPLLWSCKIRNALYCT